MYPGKMTKLGRKEGESNEEWKERRRKEDRKIDNYLQGELVWPSGGQAFEQIIKRQLKMKTHSMDAQTARSLMRGAKGTLVKDEINDSDIMSRRRLQSKTQ